LEENQKLIIFPNANQGDRFKIIEKESTEVEQVGGKEKSPSVFDNYLKQSAPDSIVPDDKGDLYEEIKKIFRDLHPQWQSYENFLFKQKGRSGLPGEGYHSYEHGFEVAYLVWLAAKGGYSKTELLESVVAASLHDFDPRKPLETPEVERTLKQLTSNQALRERLEELGVNIEVVSLLIERSDHPWDEKKNKHFEEKLEDIPQLEMRNSVKKRAELLQLLDKCSAYFFLGSDDSYKRVRALYLLEKKVKVSPDRIIKDTLEFFDDIKKQPFFNQVLNDMPDWARNNWEKNYKYYLSISERKSEKKSIFTLGFLPPLAGLTLGLTSILSTSGLEQGILGGILVLSGLGLLYSCYRLPDIMNYFKPAESPYALKDLREDLRKLQGYHIKIPDHWRLWINEETEEIPEDIKQIKFNALKISPWRLLFFWGRSSYYAPQDNSFAFHENLKSLPENRRLAVVAHELGHYLQEKNKTPTMLLWYKVPGMLRLAEELSAFHMELGARFNEPELLKKVLEYAIHLSEKIQRRLEKHGGLTTEAVKQTESPAIPAEDGSSPKAVIAASPQAEERLSITSEMRQQQALQLKGYSFNRRLLEMPWRLLQRWRAPRQSLMIILFFGFMLFHKIVQYFSETADEEYDVIAIQPLLNQMKRKSFPRDGLESRSFSPEQVRSAKFKQGNLRDLIFGRYIPGKRELTVLDFYEPLLTAMGRTSFPDEKTGLRFAIQTRAILAKLLVRQILVYRSADYYHLTSGNIIREGVKAALLSASLWQPGIIPSMLHRNVQQRDPAGYLNELRKRIVHSIPLETAQSQFARKLADSQSVVYKAYLNLASRPSPNTMTRFTKEFGKILRNTDENLRIYDLLYFSELMKQMKFKVITIATWNNGETPLKGKGRKMEVIALPAVLFDGPGAGLAIEHILQTVPRLKLNENWKKRIPRQHRPFSFLQAA
jgi:hypothetical protein